MFNYYGKEIKYTNLAYTIPPWVKSTHLLGINSVQRANYETLLLQNEKLDNLNKVLHEQNDGLGVILDKQIAERKMCAYASTSEEPFESSEEPFEPYSEKSYSEKSYSEKSYSLDPHASYSDELVQSITWSMDSCTATLNFGVGVDYIQFKKFRGMFEYLGADSGTAFIDKEKQTLALHFGAVMNIADAELIQMMHDVYKVDITDGCASLR